MGARREAGTYMRCLVFSSGEASSDKFDASDESLGSDWIDPTKYKFEDRMETL